MSRTVRWQRMDRNHQDRTVSNVPPDLPITSVATEFHNCVGCKQRMYGAALFCIGCLYSKSRAD